MQTALIFQNGTGQAVSIPKEFHLEGELVEIKKIGNNLILRPISDSWSSLFGSLDKFTDDFMPEGREQLDPQAEREAFD